MRFPFSRSPLPFLFADFPSAPSHLPSPHSRRLSSPAHPDSWLTLEPFITPSLFEPFLTAPTPAVDEWTLSVNLRKQGGGGEGGRKELERVLRGHYEGFIVR